MSACDETLLGLYYKSLCSPNLGVSTYIELAIPRKQHTANILEVGNLASYSTGSACKRGTFQPSLPKTVEQTHPPTHIISHVPASNARQGKHHHICIYILPIHTFIDRARLLNQLLAAAGMAAKAAAAVTTIAHVVVDEDELFELDIALLDGRDHDRCRRGGDRRSSPAAGADADAGHVLLANCLLPLRSVSNAVPVVATSGRLSSSSSPFFGYYSSSSSSRRLFTPRSSRRFLFLGRSAGSSSARLCFSSRGFEAMGSYFQRY